MTTSTYEQFLKQAFQYFLIAFLHMQAVQLSEMHLSTLEAKFSSLVRISFLKVTKLHDTHLEALASSKLPIQDLQVGEDISFQFQGATGLPCKHNPNKTRIPDTVSLYSFSKCPSFAYQTSLNSVLTSLPALQSCYSLSINLKQSVRLFIQHAGYQHSVKALDGHYIAHSCFRGWRLLLA